MIEHLLSGSLYACSQDTSPSPPLTLVLVPTNYRVLCRYVFFMLFIPIVMPIRWLLYDYNDNQYSIHISIKMVVSVMDYFYFNMAKCPKIEEKYKCIIKTITKYCFIFIILFKRLIDDIRFT
jgi:hypothetical protein